MVVIFINILETTKVAGSQHCFYFVEDLHSACLTCMCRCGKLGTIALVVWDTLILDRLYGAVGQIWPLFAVVLHQWRGAERREGVGWGGGHPSRGWGSGASPEKLFWENAPKTCILGAFWSEINRAHFVPVISDRNLQCVYLYTRRKWLTWWVDSPPPRPAPEKKLKKPNSCTPTVFISFSF